MQTRHCDCCGQIRTIDQFNFRNRLSGKRHTTCKECQRGFKRRFYLEHRADYIKKSAQEKKEAVTRHRSLVREYLESHPCVDCGESDPEVLEFDHQSDKDRTVAQLVLDGASWERISHEIGKCQVRCANCHRKRTAKQQGWYKRLGL